MTFNYEKLISFTLKRLQCGIPHWTIVQPQLSNCQILSQRQTQKQTDGQRKVLSKLTFFSKKFHQACQYRYIISFKYVKQNKNPLLM